MEESDQNEVLPSEAAAPPMTGQLRIHSLDSRIFRNSRMLRVWVPADYDDPKNGERHYPVFYLNDGQNLFQRETSFLGVDWQVGETAERLIDEGRVPPMIFVGIDNTRNDRIKEYLPYRSLNPPVLRPQGKSYPAFLLNEVMPMIYGRYRIARGPENTGLGGSSLGALIALFCVMERPGIFGRLLLESPSLFVSNRRLLRLARAFRSWPERIFLAIGTKESGREDRDEEVVEDLLELQHILRRAGLKADRLLVNIDAGATHTEAEWAKRFPQALEFLFGSRKS